MGRRNEYTFYRTCPAGCYGTKWKRIGAKTYCCMKEHTTEIIVTSYKHLNAGIVIHFYPFKHFIVTGSDRPALGPNEVAFHGVPGIQWRLKRRANLASSGANVQNARSFILMSRIRLANVEVLCSILCSGTCLSSIWTLIFYKVWSM
jgi:hypothetical protein